jgi:hypothetical protein
VNSFARSFIIAIRSRFVLGMASLTGSFMIHEMMTKQSNESRPSGSVKHSCFLC